MISLMFEYLSIPNLIFAKIANSSRNYGKLVVSHMEETKLPQEKLEKLINLKTVANSKLNFPNVKYFARTRNEKVDLFERIQSIANILSRQRFSIDIHKHSQILAYPKLFQSFKRKIA